MNDRGLRRMFRVGRISLLIALVVLGLSIVGGEALRGMASPFLVTIGRTLEIGGWVAMWRPLEVFLYDWWPLRAEIRLFTRLAAMPVRINYRGGTTKDWRSDWPAVPAGAERARGNG